VKLYLTLWICAAVLLGVWLPIFTHKVEQQDTIFFDRLQQQQDLICKELPEYCDQ